MDLQQSFKKIISTQFAFVKKNEPILVAVSGGVDSMVLLHLLHSIDSYNLVVAHCNYNLRKESILDEALVQSYCLEHKIPFVSKSFKTKTIAKTQKKGIQETARKLRYDFFNEVRINQNIQWVFTAHHQNDDAETILFNLIRGIDGLKGIPAVSNFVLRPLLSITKNELVKYASQLHIPYREDNSNKQNKYSRNKIRNTILPKLEKINPAAIDHLIQNSQLYKHTQQFAYDTINSQIHLYEKKLGNVSYFNFKSLIHNPYLSLYLNCYFPSQDLTQTQVENLQHSLVLLKSGKIFKGKKYEYHVSRGVVAITLNDVKQNSPLLIDELRNQIILVGDKTIKITTKEKHNGVLSLTNKLYINADLIKLPLTIRTWENGDSFTPIHFKGRKKISKYLSDKKLHSSEKKQTLVISDVSNKIIAIIGHVIDNTYQISPRTKKILQIEIL